MMERETPEPNPESTPAKPPSSEAKEAGRWLYNFARGHMMMKEAEVADPNKVLDTYTEAFDRRYEALEPRDREDAMLLAYQEATYRMNDIELKREDGELSDEDYEKQSSEAHQVVIDLSNLQIAELAKFGQRIPKLGEQPKETE